MGGKRPREQFYPEEDSGVNSKITMHNVRIYQMDKIDLRDPDAVKIRIAEYFKLCVDDDMRPSLEGLSLAFGYSRVYVWKFVKEKGEQYRGSVNAIKKAHAMIGAMLADYMQHNKINPVAGIFLMKNSYGYADGNELPIAEAEGPSEQKSLEELKRKYFEIADGNYASLATADNSSSE